MIEQKVLQNAFFMYFPIGFKVENNDYRTVITSVISYSNHLPWQVHLTIEEIKKGIERVTDAYKKMTDTESAENFACKYKTISKVSQNKTIVLKNMKGLTKKQESTLTNIIRRYNEYISKAKEDIAIYIIDNYQM